jgi:hypothetical protein
MRLLASLTLCVALVAGCRTERDPAAVGPASPSSTGAVPAAAQGAHLGGPTPGSTCHAPPPPSTARLLLERSECYGFCPAYAVEVHPDGSVSYEGKSFVRVHGVAHATIDKATAEALFAQAACAGASTWSRDYTYPVTDNPTAEVTVDLGTGTVVVVKDYPPCHAASAGYPGTPEALCQLEEAIDKAANSAAWTDCVGADGGPDYCRH